MELKEGMLIRTKEGIIDEVIIEYKGYCNSPTCNCKHVSCKFNYHDEDTIIKFSNNITDLIEVGDFISYIFPSGLGILGYEDVKVTEGLLDILKNVENNHEYTIKKIVTKEQFESVSYKVV